MLTSSPDSQFSISHTQFFLRVLQLATYEDLIRKKVWARLRDVDHTEWQICTVCAIVSAGIKLKIGTNKRIFYY